MKYYLSLMCRFRDEARYLREFLEYHFLIGFQHAYLIDHKSVDFPLGVLTPYINKGLVTLIRGEEELPPKESGIPHSSVLFKLNAMGLARARGETRWLAVLDSDEFLVPAPGVDLIRLLKDYEDVASLSLNWRLFGTSSIQKIPDNKLLLETLVYRAPKNYSQNKHFKCIIQPSLVDAMYFHHAKFSPGFFSVDTNKNRVDGPRSEVILHDKLSIFHYFLRDKNFMINVKMARRKAFGHSDKVLERMEIELNQELDLSMLPYIERLRKKVFPPDPEEYLRKHPELVVAGMTSKQEILRYWFYNGPDDDTDD